MPKPHMQHNILHDAQVMSVDQLMEEYDIEIDTDGSVWDPCECKSFKSVQEWAVFMKQMEGEDAEYQASSKNSKSNRYSDDY